MSDRATDRNGTTTANWIESPYNRWGFWHVRELTRTARIGRGSTPVVDLPLAERDLTSFLFEHEGKQVSWTAMLEATYTDAIVVLQGGKVLTEWYTNGYGPADTHLLMSCSKSLTATLCGVLVDRGRIDPEGFVTGYIPSLRGSAWEGCTVQHLLDMRSGTAFDESDYDDPDSDGRLIEEVSGYRTRTRDDLPANTCEWIHLLGNAREHGGRFEYRSILTDVIAWVMQEATGESFPELFSRDIWSKIGAKQDAEIIVDETGFPVVEGGICTTVRDFARFGLMHSRDGEIGGRSVVPAGWIRRLLVRNQDLIDAYAGAPEFDPLRPDAFYHDQWWVIDAARGVYSGYGINGQQLLIHRPSDTVIAKFSTWARGGDPQIAALQDAGLFALCESLVG